MRESVIRIGKRLNAFLQGSLSPNVSKVRLEVLSGRCRENLSENLSENVNERKNGLANSVN
jgi:hypothetical protein